MSGALGNGGPLGGGAVASSGRDWHARTLATIRSMRPELTDEVRFSSVGADWIAYPAAAAWGSPTAIRCLAGIGAIGPAWGGLAAGVTQPNGSAGTIGRQAMVWISSPLSQRFAFAFRAAAESFGIEDCRFGLFLHPAAGGGFSTTPPQGVFFRITSAGAIALQIRDAFGIDTFASTVTVADSEFVDFVYTSDGLTFPRAFVNGVEITGVTVGRLQGTEHVLGFGSSGTTPRALMRYALVALPEDPS